MKKQLIASLGVICLLSAGAFADEGIPSNILDDMGLSGIEVLSDTDASTVRGMGWQHHKSGVIAGGISGAYIKGGRRGPNGASGSINFYLAAGNHKASGYNYSQASRTSDRTKIHRYNGNVDVTRRIRRVTYSAGGISGGSAF